MKKLVFLLFFASFAFAGASQDANSAFAKKDYLAGMNILTKAINDSDPNKKADALYTFANFYENLVGNHTYALMLYNDILKTNLREDCALKMSAQNKIKNLRFLKKLYNSEDLILKRLRLAEAVTPDEIDHQMTLLQSIIEKKPEYYRLAEVYYYLGRCLISKDDNKNAYIALKEAMELKPAINFYLPVNVYKEQAHSEWVRQQVKTISKNSLGILLVITIIAFYSSMPWRNLSIRHLKIFAAIIILWLLLFTSAYILFGHIYKISVKTMTDISAPVPFFIKIVPNNPHWHVALNLFLYSLIAFAALFLFSIGTGRIKIRILPYILNSIYALFLFATIMSIFYMKQCDQKSIFYIENNQPGLHYLESSNYFVTVAMEPYILTNPKAYPNLAIENVSDVHLKEWMQKYCPFENPPGNK
jgi:tetratricopeptide (TPR) repeat protein